MARKISIIHIYAFVLIKIYWIFTYPSENICFFSSQNFRYNKYPVQILLIIKRNKTKEREKKTPLKLIFHLHCVRRKGKKLNTIYIFRRRFSGITISNFPILPVHCGTLMRYNHLYSNDTNTAKMCLKCTASYRYSHTSIHQNLKQQHR